MDFVSLVNRFQKPCCVLSVKKTEVNERRSVYIECGNEPYFEVIKGDFYEHMPYDELVPQNFKFEDICYRSAVLGERMHSYVNTNFAGGWTDQLLIPLNSDREDFGYCLFLFEFVGGPEESRVGDISIDTAALVLQTCLNLISTENFQDNVGKALDDIMGASEAEGGRILLINHYKRESLMFCEKTTNQNWAIGIPGDAIITYDLLQNWIQIIGDEKALVIETKEELEGLRKFDPDWVDGLIRYGVRSLMIVPLRRVDTIVGFLYVVNYNTKKSTAVREMVEVVSLFLGAEIANHLLFLKMDELSNYDELTGLKNRHAMMRDVDNLGEQGRGVSFGIITTDLNGLKAVNDRDGHMAGDKLIVRTAMMLTDEYGRDNVYRIGGDEFIVIFPEVGEEEFREKVQWFKENIMTRPGVSLSVGTCWYNGTGDTEQHFYQADIRMYENKREFYAAHPELKH